MAEVQAKKKNKSQPNELVAINTYKHSSYFLFHTYHTSAHINPACIRPSCQCSSQTTGFLLQFQHNITQARKTSCKMLIPLLWLLQPLLAWILCGAMHFSITVIIYGLLSCFSLSRASDDLSMDGYEFLLLFVFVFVSNNNCESNWKDKNIERDHTK